MDLKKSNTSLLCLILVSLGIVNLIEWYYYFSAELVLFYNYINCVLLFCLTENYMLVFIHSVLLSYN